MPPVSSDHTSFEADATGGQTTVTTDATARDWDAFVEQHPDGTVDHLYGWREVFQRVFGHRCEYLVARRSARIVGVLPLVLMRSKLFGRLAVSLPALNDGGLLAADPSASSELLAAAATLAREFGASEVELRHRARQCPDLPFRQHKLGLSRDLPGTTEALWQDIDRKIRNQVRKAQKEGLEAISGGAELLDAFYLVFSTNMRDLGTPVYPRALFDETIRQFPDRARVTIVRRGTDIMAGGFTLSFRGTVVNPWASSLRQFRNLCPNTLLYWHLLEQAVASGAGVFDFGRSSPGGGTHQFKLQWGAREQPLYWEYLMLDGANLPDRGPTNPKFERAVQVWQRMPLWLANVAGPLIAKHLP